MGWADLCGWVGGGWGWVGNHAPTHPHTPTHPRTHAPTHPHTHCPVGGCPQELQIPGTWYWLLKKNPEWVGGWFRWWVATPTHLLNFHPPPSK